MAKDTRPVNVYPNTVDWNDFDEEELELIEMGVDILSDYARDRKNRPRVHEIKQLFLDEFDGFEDATPAQAVAITEKLQEIWDEAHGVEAEKAPEKPSYASSVIPLITPNVPEELREKAIEAAKKMDPYVGRTDEGQFTVLEDADKEKVFDLEWEKNDIMSEIGGYRYIHELSRVEEMKDADTEEKLKTFLIWYADEFHSRLYQGEDLVRLFDRTHHGDPIGIGTPVHSVRIATQLTFEQAGISDYTFETLSLSNAKSGEGMVISIAWNEDGELHNVMGYGYGRIVDKES